MRFEDSCTLYDRGKGFCIGVGATLHIKIKGVEARLKSCVVGLELDKFLIIRTPRMAGIETMLFEGDKVSVIYLCSGTVYGFHTTLLYSIQKPSPLIFLSWPELIESKDIREFQRVEAYLPATASIHGIECKGIISDISVGGCRFTATTSLSKTEGDAIQIQVGEPILLIFELPGVSELKQLAGETRNVAQDSSGTTTWGVQFAETNAEMLNEVVSYMKAVFEAQHS
jgi:c-di-GMP-binding flagellar brake protein YcgR